jgi:hypothetical protein
VSEAELLIEPMPLIPVSLVELPCIEPDSVPEPVVPAALLLLRLLPLHPTIRAAARDPKIHGVRFIRSHLVKNAGATLTSTQREASLPVWAKW